MCQVINYSLHFEKIVYSRISCLFASTRCWWYTAVFFFKGMRQQWLVRCLFTLKYTAGVFLKHVKTKNQAFSNRKWPLTKLCCIYIYTYLIFKAEKRCHTKCLASCISMQPLDEFPAWSHNDLAVEWEHLRVEVWTRLATHQWLDSKTRGYKITTSSV